MGMILNGCMSRSICSLMDPESLCFADDGSLVSGLQASDAWQADLNYPDGVRLGMLNAVGFISGLIVGPIITYIDENWGRRWGIRCKFTVPLRGMD